MENQKRNIRYTVRFNSSENEILTRNSRFCNLEPSAYIRMAVCKKELRPVLTDEEKSIYRQLIGISNNINQLQKAINIHGPFSLLVTIVKTLEEINKIINRIKQ